MKGCYENMELILNKIKYKEYNWVIYVNLKVVSILTGLQSFYTKYCCFLCKWDSRDRASHYNIKSWPLRQEYKPGYKNVARPKLIEPQKIVMPVLHIKLGLMKNFVEIE